MLVTELIIHLKPSKIMYKEQSVGNKGVQSGNHIVTSQVG